MNHPAKFVVVEPGSSNSKFLEIRVYAGEEQLGFVYLVLGDGAILLDIIHVDSRYRGRGLGSSLVEEVERLARGLKCRRVHGEVTVNDYTSTPEKRDVRAEWFRKRGYSATKQPDGDWVIEKDL